MPPQTTKIERGKPYALQGRVVTMDADFRVLKRGRVYIDAQGRIAAVKSAYSQPPAGFEAAPIVKTRGTIYPGLIELHNHLSYNALTLWKVPECFTDRNVWRDTDEYRKRVSGPMCVLGQTEGYPEAIVRYAECKCLLGGVTTTQGVALFSRAGIVTFYKGIVRNVEMRNGPDMPGAGTQIGDVRPADAQEFLRKLQKRPDSCLFLHLSEGTDDKTYGHYRALQLPDGGWAMTPALAGIHCVALKPGDYATLGAHSSSMVWSPLSNLLLYGQTAQVQAAKTEGVRIGLGSDWSPSGSKNLLGELKVARLYSEEHGDLFTDRELVAMATRNAAQILRWDRAIGSIEPGKRADLLVIGQAQGDPYATLLEASERDIGLVTIDGIPRCGRPDIMGRFLLRTEEWQVAGEARPLNLEEDTSNPVVGELTLREAWDRLADGLERLPELAAALDARDLDAEEPQWSLVLDQQEAEDAEMMRGLVISSDEEEMDEVARGLFAARGQLRCRTELIEPLQLDPLTVADDPGFFDRIGEQPNLPSYVKEKLPGLY